MVKAVKSKEYIRVRMVPTPQIEYRFAYWDIYPYVYTNISDIIPEDDKRDLENLFQESLLEFPEQENFELDVVVKVKTESLIKIQDRLNIELSKECSRLSEILNEKRYLIKGGVE